MTASCATCEPTTVPDPDSFQADRPAGVSAAPTAGGPRRVLVAMVTDALTAGAFLPLMFLYLSATTDLSVSDIGLLLSVGGFAGLLLNPLAGMVVDRIGAGRTVLAANLVAAVGFAGLLWVGSVVHLAAVVALVSLGQRLYWSAWPVFIAGQLPPGASLDRWFGMVNAAKSGALGVGSAAAAGLLVVSGPPSLRLLVVVAAVGSLGCALLLRPVIGTRAARADHGWQPQPLGPEVVASAAGGWSTVLHDRLYLSLTAAHTALTFAWLMLGLAVPMYLVGALGLPGWLPSAALALNTALTVLLQQRVTAALDRWRRTRAIVLGTGAFLVAFALLPVTALATGRHAGHTASLLLAGAVVTVAVLAYALGEMTVGPAASALAIELSPTELRGRYSAMFQTSWTLSSVAGPVVIGLLIAWSPSGLWLVMGLVVAAGGLGFVAAERRIPPALLRMGTSTARPGTAG